MTGSVSILLAERDPFCAVSNNRIAGLSGGCFQFNKPKCYLNQNIRYY